MKPKLVFKHGFWWVEANPDCYRGRYRETVKWATLQNYKLHPPRNPGHGEAKAISEVQMRLVRNLPVLEPIQRY